MKNFGIGRRRNAPDSSSAGPSDASTRQSRARPGAGGLLDQLSSSTVKLHEVCEPQLLGLRGYSNRRSEVAPKTLENLELGSDIILRTKQLLPHGSGNQRVDIEATRGESYLRTCYARREAVEPTVNLSNEEIFEYAGEAISAGAGNCSERSKIAFTMLAQAQVSDPVLIARNSGENHTYVLLGDPRSPGWGEKNTVVIDSWPGLATACTLREAQPGKYRPDFYSLGNEPYRTARPQGLQSSLSAAAAAALEANPVSGADLKNYGRRVGLPRPGPALVSFIKNAQDDVCRSDPSVRYAAEGSVDGGQTYDAIDPMSLERRRRNLPGVRPPVRQQGFVIADGPHR